MRFNWSILNKANDVKAVLDYYNGLDGYKNEAMEQGILLHEQIAQKRMQLIEGMDSATYEYRFEFGYDKDVVSGHIDVLTDDMVIDWKVSTRDAKKHDMKQLQFYNWCLVKSGQKSRKYGIIVQISPQFEVLSKAVCELGEDMGDWYRERRNRIIYILTEYERGTK